MSTENDAPITSRRLVRAPWECARRLADLHSISIDLKFCADCCDRITQLASAETPDVLLEQALWTAALISYSRCFASGRRFGLDESTFNDQEPLVLQLHRYFRDTRDKYVAHSVSPFEQVEPALLFDASEPPKEVVGTLMINTRLHPEMGVEASNLKSLAVLVHRALESVGAETEKEVMRLANQTPFSEVRSFPPCTYVHPGWEQAGVPRRRSGDAA